MNSKEGLFEIVSKAGKIGGKVAGRKLSIKRNQEYEKMLRSQPRLLEMKNEILTWRKSGLGTWKIAKRLNNEGFYSIGGNSWTYMRVYKLLRFLQNDQDLIF